MGRGAQVCVSLPTQGETESNRLSSRQYRDKYLETPRNTRNDLRSGAWCFDGGQPEVNLRFTRQYRLLLAPPRALPRVPRGTARARAPHNSHNKSPRTTDARSTYKGITDQKEDRRVRVKGGVGRARNNGSTQIAKPPLLRKALLLLYLETRGGRFPIVPRRIYEVDSSWKSFISMFKSSWSVDRYTTPRFGFVTVVVEFSDN